MYDFKVYIVSEYIRFLYIWKIHFELRWVQLDEIMNACFDSFVHSKTMLKEFIDQFDNTLRKKVENEMETNFH